ncbi:glycosyl transferase [Bacterioplanes sanyensis]|uniref:Glycosyl transferase n=1 Tax=Bacterioplanes sanyensis TaxID=1249553 RepID=A0A222FFI1_9GAMM|nr:glycosyltransferase family 4 protein [Bacterioplanes sanyensis]ASP37509.1 glycosyl transferase [Bacterioplanes sanyensis]
MNVLIAANQVPFIAGGADLLTQGLVDACRAAGHQVELLRLPFQFSPASSIERGMNYCAGLDLTQPNGQAVDRMISLQFPLYGCQHPNHRVWLMHQHRAAYDLLEADAPAEQQALAQQIRAFDQQHLSSVKRCYTIAGNVSRRLQEYSGIDSQPLYHPPALAQHYQQGDAWDYVFFPSRIETLKRQWLLIEAAQYLTSPMRILIAGDGGQLTHCQQRVKELGLQERIVFLGRISDELKISAYKHALAVFYGPRDEDLGYITLEAMLAGKPVVTCRDSGGPLEFVEHQVTGLITEPEPQSIAAALDELWFDRQRSERMGQAGLEKYHAFNLSWHTVVDTLLQDVE